MSPFEMTAQQRQALNAICERFDVARLELFGSATQPTFEPERSDLDFLVEFTPGAHLGPWLATYFDLRDALEELFARPVDLVLASAPRNPFFIQSVNATRRAVYERQIAQAA